MHGSSKSKNTPRRTTNSQSQKLLDYSGSLGPFQDQPLNPLHKCTGTLSIRKPHWNQECYLKLT